MRQLNPAHLRAVLEVINQGPFFRHLSMLVKEIGPGYSLVELDVGREHLNPFGGLHGGVYASVIDTAAYWAAYCELDQDVGFISLDLKVDYLAPVQAGRLTVRGRRIKIGRTICLAEAVAVDQNDKWRAHGVSRMMVTQSLQTIADAWAFTDAGELPPKFLS